MIFRFKRTPKTRLPQQMARKRQVPRKRQRPRKGLRRCESLEGRMMMAADALSDPMDVNADGDVSAGDALVVINYLNATASATTSTSQPPATPEALEVPEALMAPEAVVAPEALDVNRDDRVSAVDALQVINYLNVSQDSSSASAIGSLAADVFSVAKATGVGTQFNATFSDEDSVADNLLSEADVETLLQRASQATASDDAIIAVVDRSGRILGVRVEDGVSATLQASDAQLAFAIDGAVAKARTAAFFSSNAAPLTSRTIRFISQSTVTQREVESSPTHTDDRYRGPGFVAPIGVGGHFPPEIPFTPQVDLFAIEHQSRDSQTHPGADGDKATTADNFELFTRFNTDPQYIPANAEAFFQTWPESFGEQSGMDETATPRGIATLPGGVPLYKTTVAAKTDPAGTRLSDSVNLVGGIGVFFPGEDGFATHEQGFEHGVGQSERGRTNADKVLEAEYAALVASAGGGIFSAMSGFSRSIDHINTTLPIQTDFLALNGRIDLVGITLEIYGPTPSRAFRMPGIDRLLQFGQELGQGADSG